jgi:pimeloyl-ACP methyl ester carboxylesterase
LSLDDTIEGRDAPERGDGTFASRFVTARDGLALHYRDYGDRLSPGLPVLCLPGLTRSSRDFHDVALRLSQDTRRPRRVISVDYRGRGLSEHDPEWENYTPLVELDDVLAAVTAAGLLHCAVVGTSRGGILAMLMAVRRPGILAGVILNDIGPEIEPRGLVRLKRMLAEATAPRNWREAVENAKRVARSQFPQFSEEDWMRVARLTYREIDGRPAVDFDPALAKTLDGIDVDSPPPKLWNQFAALGNIPTLAIHGAHSDILTPAVLEEMKTRKPDLETITVADQGHAPFLWEKDLLDRIADFVRRCDERAGGISRTSA